VKKKLNKFIACLMICLSVFMNGCQKNDSDSEMNGKSNIVPATDLKNEKSDDYVVSIENESEILDKLKAQLENDFSFRVSYEYRDIVRNGVSQHLEQITGKDGSFYFIDEFHQWDNGSEYDYEQKVEYYYRYEDGTLVCYMKKNNEEVTRSVIPEEVVEQMDEDELLFVGKDVLFPSYLEDFSEEVSGETYTFTLPITKVLEGNSYLAAFLNNVFRICIVEYDSSTEVDILCTVETEKDTYLPMKISYNFDELKPYIFTSGALSAEPAFEIDLMQMVYEFDYDLQDTIEVPEEFL